MIMWTQRYALGIDEIDRQHRELFRRMNQLEEQLGLDDGKELVDDTLHFLLVYVNVHFQDEEKLMTQWEYPRLEEHSKQHSGFVRRVQGIMAEERNQYNAPELRQIVVEWIAQHVLHEDMALRDYYDAAKENSSTGL